MCMYVLPLYVGVFFFFHTAARVFFIPPYGQVQEHLCEMTPLEPPDKDD